MIDISPGLRPMNPLIDMLYASSAFLEKSNAKRQQTIQMKSEIEKTTESVSKIEKNIKEL